MLPRDLSRLVWQQIPFTVAERYPTAALKYWLQQRSISNFATFERGYLTEREWYLKIATWSGEVGTSNQLFLPHHLAVLQAASTSNLSAFRNALLRGQWHENLLLVILRQLRATPTSAETMLCYALAAAPVGKILFDLSSVLDEMILGRIVFTVRACRIFLHYCDFPVGSALDYAVRGISTAIDRTYPIPGEDSKAVVFLQAYLLAGGTQLVKLTAENNIPEHVLFDTGTLLNRDLIAGSDYFDDEIALGEIAYHLLAKLPRNGLRDFPENTTSIYDHDYAMMAERAAHILPLVLAIYADSPDRDLYLSYLTLLLKPDIPIIALRTIPHDDHFLALLGRFDLMAETVTNPFFAEIPTLSRTRSPLKLLELIAAQPQQLIHLDHLVFEAAILTDTFAEVAAAYFRTIPATIRINSQVDSNFDATLDKFRLVYDGGFLQVEPTRPGVKYRQDWDNSYMLQSLLPAVQIVDVAKDVRDFLSNDESAVPGLMLRLSYRNKIIIERVNAYEYQAWRQLLSGLPTRDIPDHITPVLAQLLATS